MTITNTYLVYGAIVSLKELIEILREHGTDEIKSKIVELEKKEKEEMEKLKTRTMTSESDEDEDDREDADNSHWIELVMEIRTSINAIYGTIKPNKIVKGWIRDLGLTGTSLCSLEIFEIPHDVAELDGVDVAEKYIIGYKYATMSHGELKLDVKAELNEFIRHHTVTSLKKLGISSEAMSLAVADDCDCCS